MKQANNHAEQMVKSHIDITKNKGRYSLSLQVDSLLAKREKVTLTLKKIFLCFVKIVNQ
jgi:hypothetical protein